MKNFSSRHIILIFLVASGKGICLNLNLVHL